MKLKLLSNGSCQVKKKLFSGGLLSIIRQCIHVHVPKKLKIRPFDLICIKRLISYDNEKKKDCNW